MRCNVALQLAGISLLAGACVLTAQTTQAHLIVLSAAGGVGFVAPGELAVGYAQLGAAPQTGQLDQYGALPTELGGYQVLVNGTAAHIQYVGPSQVNFIVPPDANLGDNPVMVRLSNQDLATGNSPIRPIAPAIFTMVQGSREVGAILNAVTFSANPFASETAQITGCDKRTRLAVFGTGMGFALNRVRARDVRAEAQDSSGAIWPLDVEAAVAAPGLPGVEQINVALPGGLPPGTMLMRVYANGVPSNAVGFDVLPASAATPNVVSNAACLGEVTFARNLQGGGSITGTVSLAYRAPAGGITVNVVPDSPVIMPSQVTIPEGKLSATFPITPSANGGLPAKLTITASTGNDIRTGSFESGAACVDGLALGYSGVVSGLTMNGNVTLTDPAPDGGVTVRLSSNNTSVSVPATVVVPAGQLMAPISISTSARITPETAVLSASSSCGGTVTPLNVVVTPCVSSVSLPSASVAGGAATIATVYLNAAALAGGVAVNLNSTDPSVQVDSQVIVPEGQTSATFMVKASGVSSMTRTAIIATVPACGVASAGLVVMPQ